MPTDPQTVPAIPATGVAFDAANSEFHAYAVIVITPEGSTESTAFRVGEVTNSGKNEFKPLEEPGDDGVLVPVRRDQTKREESTSFKTREIGKVIKFTGGKNISINAKVREYKFDPKDAPGTCRRASEEYLANVEIDGDTKSGGSAHTEIGIKITSLKPGAIQWFWKPALVANP